MNKILVKFKGLIKIIPFIRPIFNSFYIMVVTPKNIINLGLYTTSRTLKFSRSRKNIQSWKASIRVSCHIIEKGLTMPNKRLGFGQGRVLNVISEILSQKKYQNLPDMKIAIGVIKEYDKLHKDKKHPLPIKFQNEIDKVLYLYPELENQSQIFINKNEYFSDNNSSFRDFAKSRHSIRSYSGNVSIDIINNSIELALTAPSACNRQAIRCHIFNNPDVIQNILSLQDGNRGFGQLIPQLCILTIDLRMIGANEQNDVYLNGGIFTMNLCYAFHYNRVGNVILNWSVTPSVDKRLKKITNIQKAESIITIIAFGTPSDEIEITRSQRKHLDDTVVYH